MAHFFYFFLKYSHFFKKITSNSLFAISLESLSALLRLPTFQIAAHRVNNAKNYAEHAGKNPGKSYFARFSELSHYFIVILLHRI